MIARDPVQNLLSHLEKVKRSGAGWTALCPAHDDRERSLSIGEGEDGRALLHCHAGCITEGILAAVGLTPADLFVKSGSRPSPTRANGSPPTRPRKAQSGPGRANTSTGEAEASPKAEFAVSEEEVSGWQRALLDSDAALQRLWELRGWGREALERLGVGLEDDRVTLPYRDAAGTLVGLGRYLPNEGTRNGRAKLLAEKESTRELFPGPETLNGDGWLFLCEGEADALRALSVGIPAVGTPGMATWKDGWAERFAGRKVAVVFDCERRARARAETVAAALAAVAADVRIVDIDPERDDDYDLSDWLSRDGAENGAHKLLEQMAELAPPVEAASLGGAGEAADATEPNTRPALCWVDPLTVTPEDLEWLLPGRIPVGMPTLIVGNEGEGKSLFAAWLCTEAALGKFLDGPIASVYCSAEDHTTKTISPRLRALGCPQGFVSTLSMTAGEVGLSVPEDIKLLEARIEETGAKLVIFDPFVSYLSDSTDSHRDHSVRRALVPLAELAARRDLALVLVVHTNKGASGEFRLRVMGSKAFNAFARSSLLWSVDPDADDQGTTKRRILAHAKQNLSEKQEALAFEIETRPVSVFNRRIQEHVERRYACLRYVGTSTATEEDMLSGGSDRKAIQRAKALLQEELYPPGHWYLAPPIVQLAVQEGISADTLRRAREQLDITRKKGNVKKEEFKNNKMQWRLPPDFLQADAA